MFSLLRRGRQLGLSFKTQADLFDQLVAPILMYGCEVWGYEDIEKIQVVQKKFYKYMLRLNTSTPSAMVFGEFGKFPIDLKIKEQMVGYWAKLKLEPNTKKWNVIMLNIIEELAQGKFVNSKWFNYIKLILTECSKDHLLYQGINDVTIEGRIKE